MNEIFPAKRLAWYALAILAICFVAHSAFIVLTAEDDLDQPWLHWSMAGYVALAFSYVMLGALHVWRRRPAARMPDVPVGLAALLLLVPVVNAVWLGWLVVAAALGARRVHGGKADDRAVVVRLGLAFLAVSVAAPFVPERLFFPVWLAAALLPAAKLDKALLPQYCACHLLALPALAGYARWTAGTAQPVLYCAGFLALLLAIMIADAVAATPNPE